MQRVQLLRAGHQPQAQPQRDGVRPLGVGHVAGALVAGQHRRREQLAAQPRAVGRVVRRGEQLRLVDLDDGRLAVQQVCVGVAGRRR